MSPFQATPYPVPLPLSTLSEYTTEEVQKRLRYGKQRLTKDLTPSTYDFMITYTKQCDMIMLLRTEKRVTALQNMDKTLNSRVVLQKEMSPTMRALCRLEELQFRANFESYVAIATRGNYLHAEDAREKPAAESIGESSSSSSSSEHKSGTKFAGNFHLESDAEEEEEEENHTPNNENSLKTPSTNVITTHNSPAQPTASEPSDQDWEFISLPAS